MSEDDCQGLRCPSRASDRQATTVVAPSEGCHWLLVQLPLLLQGIADDPGLQPKRSCAVVVDGTDDSAVEAVTLASPPPLHQHEQATPEMDRQRVH